MKRTSAQSGLTLVEVLVVLLIATTILLASFQLIDETSRVTLFAESRNDLPVLAQGAINTIQNALTQSRQVFEQGGVGAGYFAAISLPADAPLLEDSRPPTAQTSGDFTVDGTSGNWTGNCLLVARQLEPLRIDYAADGGGSLDADRYRFELFYLTQRTDWKFSGSDFGHLEVVRAWSGEYADFFQLSNLTLTNDQRTEINTALIAAGLTSAWNPGAVIGSAFQKIQSNGNYQQVNNPEIALSQVKDIAKLGGGRIFGAMRYSVAFRHATGGFPIKSSVPLFATYDPSTPLFPSGLEFKVSGQGSSQRVLSRLVLMAHYRAKEYASQEVSVITASGGGV